MRCHTPGCQTEITEGRWCEPHAERLARIRAELEGGIEYRLRRKGRSVPSCKLCSDPRKPGSVHCLTHDRMFNPTAV